MLEKGIKIQIKSASEIQKTLDEKGYTRNVFFAPEMKAYCGEICTIGRVINDYECRVNENIFSWVDEWFDVISPSEPCFNDGSIEQRSLCLALIRQTMSGNVPDLSMFTSHSPCNTKSYGGFDYEDFRQDEWYHTIAKNIPDWPCLTLKPQILEKALQYLLKYRGPSKFQDYISGLVETWFNWDQTSEGADYWRTVCSAIPENTKFKKSELVSVKTTINKINYENQLQRKKSDLVRGTVPEGNIICGRKCKTSVSIGHLSNKVCIGI